MPKSAPKRRKKIWFASILLAAVLILGVLFFRRQRHGEAPPVERVLGREFEAQLHLDGLTEAQAADRLVEVDLEALQDQENKDFRRRALRQNLLTTFNIDLFIIAIIMLLLDSPWSTVTTLIVLALSVSINVFQEVFTKNILDQILENIHPQATVILEGMFRSINRTGSASA